MDADSDLSERALSNACAKLIAVQEIAVIVLDHL
jgi:hypothetical protein